MPRPGYRYAISALKERRSALAGEIQAMEYRIAACEADMAHIDASLRILAPETDTSNLPKKRFQPRVKLFRQGDLSRMVLRILRRSRRPMGTHEIAGAIEEGNGYAAGTLGPRVRGNLCYLQRTGRVTKTGNGKASAWEISALA